MGYLGKMKRDGTGTLFLRPQVVVGSPCLERPSRPVQVYTGQGARAPPFKEPAPETGNCFLSFPFWASISFFILKSIPCLKPSPSPALPSPRLKHSHRHLYFSWIVFWGGSQPPLIEHALGTRLTGMQGQGGQDTRTPGIHTSLGSFLIWLEGLSEICL